MTSRARRARRGPCTWHGVMLGLVLGAAIAGAPGEAAAQSSLGFFPERHVACREPRPVAAPRAPRPATAPGLLPLPRRAAPPVLPVAPLVVIDVAVAEPVPARPGTHAPPREPPPPVMAAAEQDWRCIGFTRGKAGILRVVGAPPLVRFADHGDGHHWRLRNARAASAAGFLEAEPALARWLERPVPEGVGVGTFDALDEKLHAALGLEALGGDRRAPRFARHLRTREDDAYSTVWIRGVDALADLDASTAEVYAAGVVARIVAGRRPTDPRAPGDDTLLRAVLPLLVTPDAERLALVRRLPDPDDRCDVLAARVRLGDRALRDVLRPELVPDLRTQRGVACYSDLMPVVFPGEALDEVDGLLYRHRLQSILDLLARGRGQGDAAWIAARAKLRAALSARSQDPEVAGDRGDHRFSPVKRARHLVALAELGDPAARAAVEAMIVDPSDRGVAPWIAAAQALRLDWPRAADLAATRLALARTVRTEVYDSEPDPTRGHLAVNAHVRVIDALAARRDERFALGLLDREVAAREAAAVHLGHLRLPGACDVVAAAAPGADERPVQDALWTLSMLGDTCRAQAHRLATGVALPPHVRGMALELLAMMRDPRARPLVADHGRNDDIRPARRRARIILDARE